VKILPVIMSGARERGSGRRRAKAFRNNSFPSLACIPPSRRRPKRSPTKCSRRQSSFPTPSIVFLVAEQLQNINREARIVLEPVRRDSGPAVAVAAELAAQSGPDTIVAVLAADHVVRDREGFVALCKKAAESGGARLYRDPRHQAGRARHWLGYIKNRQDGHAGWQRVQGRGLRRKARCRHGGKYVAGNYL